MPLITWVLGIGVIALVLIFRSSSALADIYGVAVTGTFCIDTILFLAVAHSIWKVARWKLVLIGTVLLIVELSFFSSNVSKVSHGAWIPLCVGLVTALLHDHLAPGLPDRRAPAPRRRRLRRAFLDEFARARTGATGPAAWRST